MTDLKFSVITVSYNQGEFIKDTIESVLAQNYPNFEHIVIDGGSTDNTLDILRSYPHLKWTSEPDRGQTHALNKGFARATGDIIAWLNSDDWYPPNIFREVSEALKTEPIVMGMCQLTDKEKNPTELFPNVPRSWFDILKYWIFHSVPSQPSIFFKRDLLEMSKRPDGTYLDEDLNFCMDYDLWLRMTKIAPLKSYIPKVLSYYRNYDTNKTGQDFASAYREMSRVFSRHSNIESCPEKALSFVIPITTVDAALKNTLASIQAQDLRDVDVLLVDYQSDEKLSRGNKKAIVELDRESPLMRIHHTRAHKLSLFGALNRGVQASGAPILAFLEPGSTVQPSFALESINLFATNPVIGAGLSTTSERTRSLVRSDPPHPRLNVEALFTAPWIPPVFIARKISLLELGGFDEEGCNLSAFRSLLIRLLTKGWHVQVDRVPQITIPERDLSTLDNETLQRNVFLGAKMIVSSQDERAGEPFGETRARHGFSLNLPPEIVERCRGILREAPPGVFNSFEAQ